MLRTVTMYKYEVGIEEMKQAEDGRFDLVRVPLCEVEFSTMTPADMRRAIKDAGFDCPRGAQVYATRTEKITYKYDLAKLPEIAESREVDWFW